MQWLAEHSVVKFFLEGVWRDEAFSWAMATRGLAAVSLTTRDVHPPLYYLLLHVWMQVTGSSEAAMRSLSLLFFVATLWVAWRFMVDLLGVPGRRAWLYLLVFALNPMLSYYAVEVRMYSLLAFLAMSSFYAHLTNRPGLYIVTTTAGLYTHYFMVLVIGCQVLAAALTDPRMAELRRRLWVLAAPLALFAPWILFHLSYSDDVGSDFWQQATGWRFALHLVTSIYTGHDAVYGFLDRPERRFFAVCLIPIVIWSLWSGSRWAERRPVVLHIAMWALVPATGIFLLSLVRPLFVPRYLIFSTVGLLLLFAAGMERARPVLRGAMFFVLCAVALHYQVLQAQRHSKGLFRETITEIATQAGPDDLLCVRDPLDFFPAVYYFDDTRVFIVGTTHEDLKLYTGKVLIPRERVVPTIPSTGQRIFLLEGHDTVSILRPDRAP